MIEDYLREAEEMRAAGDFTGAAELCAKAIEADDADHRPHFLLGLIAVNQSQLKDARNYFGEAVRLAPDDKDTLLNYGMSLRDFGEFDKARDCFLRSIEIDRTFAPGYFALFNVIKVAPDNEHIEHLENALRIGIKDQYEESLAHFALGKAYDDLGEWDKAFPNFETGNELQGQIYDHQNTLNVFDRVKNVFTRERMEMHKGTGNSSRAPIFIIGMPRSGSSLAEDLLCRNDNVTGYGERTEIAQIVVKLEKTHPSHTPYPEIVEQITGDQFSKLADLYLNLIEKIEPLKERAVDKNILNHSLAGVIRMMFANAAIVHTVRDPIDTCLSCFFQNFRNGMEFSYDLHNLGARYAAYADIMAHWEEVMGESIYKLQYEELTQDKDDQISRLFDHVGISMPAGDAIEQPAKRAVPTASGWQARQPIYTTSIKRWKNYEKHLGPLFESLESAGFHYEEK